MSPRFLRKVDFSWVFLFIDLVVGCRRMVKLGLFFIVECRRVVKLGIFKVIIK